MERFAWTGLMLLSVAVSGHAHAEKPAKLVFTEGSPLQAVFEGARETYALGCSALGMQWAGVPEAKLSTKEWQQVMKSYPLVAGINCDSRTIKFFTPPGGPGGLIFQHYNGKMYYHYVDDPGFLNAIDSNPSMPHAPQQLLTAKDLASRNYIPGVDFTHTIGKPVQLSSMCQFDTGETVIADKAPVGSICRCGCGSGTIVSRPSKGNGTQSCDVMFHCPLQ